MPRRYGLLFRLFGETAIFSWLFWFSVVLTMGEVLAIVAIAYIVAHFVAKYW